MTISDLLKIGSDLLNDAGKDDSNFDASILAQYVLDCDYSFLKLHCNETVGKEKKDLFFEFVKRRANGEPLQYIIGEWEFMGLPFKVGRGVLIPRPETEILVEFSVDFLKDRDNPIVFDLCSGSGCIGISVAKLCPNVTVYSVEKSEKAFQYLLSNVELNRVKNVKPINGDIFDRSILSDITPDLILSNPPYIRSSEIDGLQHEVKKEPVMALDGGSDGLLFYREIADFWIDKISDNGAVAVECGEDQTYEIATLFAGKHMRSEMYIDYGNLPRGVIAYK